MKTALQEAIDQFEKSDCQMFSRGAVIERLSSLIEKEKRQIIKAQQSKPWIMERIPDKPGFYNSKDISGEDYYNETYGK